MAILSPGPAFDSTRVLLRLVTRSSREVQRAGCGWVADAFLRMLTDYDENGRGPKD